MIKRLWEWMCARYRYHFVEWHCESCGVELPKGQAVCSRPECIEEYDWKRMGL